LAFLEVSYVQNAMPAFYTIVCEPSLGGIETGFRAYTMPLYTTELQWTAEEIGVTPLSEFFSAQFFPPDEGLRSLQALIREIDAWPPVTSRTADLLRDLRACEHILI
jgi:hypothetical protein